MQYVPELRRRADELLSTAHNVPPHMARHMAEMFLAMAREYERLADRYDHIERSKTHAREQIASLITIADEVKEALIGDTTLQQAQMSVAIVRQCPIETVQAYWKIYEREHKAECRAWRNAHIIRLAKMGMLNKHIAVRLNISTRTVQRALSKVNYKTW